MGNLVHKKDWSNEAALSNLAEGIEQAAWRDAMQAVPAWALASCGIHATDVGDAFVIASRHSVSLMFNRAIGLGERVPAGDEQIAQIMELFWECGARQYLIHAGAYARPIRLGRKLQQHGLQPYRRSWVKLIRGTEELERPDTQAVVRMGEIGDAHYVASIAGPAFDLTQAEAEIFAHVVARPRWIVFVAEIDGEVAGVGGLFIEGNMAYLPFSATRPAMRSKGAQRALLHARIQAAHAAGCDYVATETGFPLTADEPSPSYHNMLWAGFRPLSIRDNYAPVGTEWTQEASGA